MGSCNNDILVPRYESGTSVSLCDSTQQSLLLCVKGSNL